MHHVFRLSSSVALLQLFSTPANPLNLPTQISKTSDEFFTLLYISLLFTLFILLIYSCVSWQKSMDTWMFQILLKANVKYLLKITQYPSMSNGFQTSAKTFNFLPKRQSVSMF